MKVILTQDYRSLGKVGDLVKVADGFARNFLIPRRIAMLATEDRVKEFKHLQAARASIWCSSVSVNTIGLPCMLLAF